jgi:hypothetical protein
MDPLKPPSHVELAVRHALEHATAVGDRATAEQLSAILQAIALRACTPAPGGGWDTVPASGRMH